MAVNRRDGWSEFFSRLDAAALASTAQLVELLPGGHREGREYRCGNINGGPGSSFGFNLDTGIWVDFATGEKGGVGFVSLYARVHGLKNGEAALEIARKTGVEPPASLHEKPTRKLKIVEKGGWKPVAPFAEMLKEEHWNDVQLPPFPEDWGKATDGWLYLDDTGQPWNYRIRFETADGKKDYRPLSWCEDERGAHSWRWRDMPAPRLLWNIEKLVKWPDRPVVVVEGEKSADAAERLLGPAGYVVVTWGGGAGNEHHSEWTPLLQRETTIYLWPDNDDPGREAMVRIGQMFGQNADVRAVKPNPAWDEKTDLADLEALEWDTECAVTWLLENSVIAESPVTPEAVRPQCDLAERDHGILQTRAWTAIRQLNNKKEGPFYFISQNGKHGELRTVRPNAFDERSMISPDVAILRAQITRDISFRSSNSSGPCAASPDADLLTSLISMPDERLPALNRFVRIPIMARDGRLISMPGFDKLSGIFYAPSKALRGMKLIEHPSKEDFVSAKEVVEDLLTDFNFATDADHANAYALMLLPILRELIDGPTPMHRIEAPSWGTGKTLFLTIALLPTLGQEQLWFLPETRDEDEWRKMLVGALRDDWPAILIDNVRNLNSGVLASLLTAQISWGGRLMHKQEISQYRVKATLACTVNNPTWTLEMHRRMQTIRLDAKVEHPFERTGAKPGTNWKHPAIVRYVIRERPIILAALITLARYGLDHKKTFTRTKGSYEAWAQVMGSVLTALGFEDFLKQKVSEDATIGTDGLSDLMAIFADLGPFDLDTAYLRACDLEALVLNGKDDRSRKIALGRLLLDCRDQVRAGYVLKFLGISNHKKRFSVQKIDNV